MGNQSSKNRGDHSWSSSLSAPLELIDRSMISDNDLIGNLCWSLTESMRWEERAVTVKDIICVEGSHEANNLSKSQQEERYQAALELLDGVLNYSSHTKSTPTASSAFSSATKTKESVNPLFTAKSSEQQQATQQQSSYPASTTLLPPSSTKLFAAAACKFVISSISHGSSTRERSSWFGGESGSKVSQAMSPIQKTIASALQTGTPFEGIAGLGISQQMVGVSTGEGLQMGSPASHGIAEHGADRGTVKGDVTSMLAFPPDHIIERYHSESMYERVEIACKYIYLLSLMKSLTYSTVWCYQLHEKIKWFNDCINDSTASVAKGNRHRYSHAELHKKQMELAKDRVYLLLQDGLKSHDRWKCVLRFGFRDFELCMARHKLQTECARWQYCRDNSQSKQALVWKVNEMDEKLNTLNAQKQALDLEVEKNERDALSCGLAFLDKNLSGSLEAEETPELNAKLFSLLDIQHRAAISYSDLHHGVLSIQERLENITARIQVLQQQNEQSQQRSSYSSYQSTETSSIASDTGADSALVIQNEFEIQQLKRASIEHWNNLQQIYSVFFNAFAQSVFPSVQLNEIDQIQNQVIVNGDAIVQIIDHISNMSLTDPLISMQTKLQRGDVSLTSQAALDASIIAESQQTPDPTTLEAAQTTPLTIHMALATTPATQQHPPSTFEQTTKPKSEFEMRATEKAVAECKRALGRQQQLAEHPSGTALSDDNIGGVKDVHGNPQDARNYARQKAAEMRTSQMENVLKRSDIEWLHEKPAPIGTEKGITDGYCQQKEAQFSDDSSLMKSTERSDTTPQSPERQSQSCMVNNKNTARSVTGGSQTSTH